MSTNSGSEQDVRHHYTLVCQCEWDEDEFTRTVESRNCVIHGDEPDPLVALLAEVEQLRAALDLLLPANGWHTVDEVLRDLAVRG